MTREEFDRYCDNLKATTNVIQWGGASVWKVGDKIFAICSDWGPDGNYGPEQKISFKCSDLSYQILCELPDIIPAPYLARAKWVQITKPTVLPDADLQDYIATAHSLIAGKLPRKVREELGL